MPKLPPIMNGRFQALVTLGRERLLDTAAEPDLRKQHGRTDSLKREPTPLSEGEMRQLTLHTKWERLTQYGGEMSAHEVSRYGWLAHRFVRINSEAEKLEDQNNHCCQRAAARHQYKSIMKSNPNKSMGSAMGNSSTYQSHSGASLQPANERPETIALRAWAARRCADPAVVKTAARITEIAADLMLSRAVEVLKAPEEYGGDNLEELAGQICGCVGMDLEHFGAEETVGILEKHFEQSAPQSNRSPAPTPPANLIPLTAQEREELIELEGKWKQFLEVGALMSRDEVNRFARLSDRHCAFQPAQG